MSHFFTVVILNGKYDEKLSDHRKSHIHEKVEELLEGFSEELEVNSYMTPCHCIGFQAQKDVNNQIDQEFGSLVEFKEKFNAENKCNVDYEANPEEWKKRMSEIDELWKEQSKPRWDREAALLKIHPLKDTPDPKCESCLGTGQYETTYNPNSKWDWWRVGGRWDGVISKTEIPKGDGFNFGDNHEDIQMNSQSCKFLDENKIIPFAIVTPDGEWHERGKMGWWGMVSNEKEPSTWEEMTHEIYKKYSDHIAIGCDLHI